uniref:Uncharacterized protein n=1 Tax=Nelumbo nucifera TaxID=4432 RepID=A0A822YN45_NELNU|nr:TPA_asm: hypothetical protein HUJ06_011286 [Nelumbo nucifera]
MKRGESLKKQMEILIELKATLKQQRNKENSAEDSKEDPSISSTISCDAEFERNEAQFSESPRSNQIGKSIRMKREEEDENPFRSCDQLPRKECEDKHPTNDAKSYPLSDHLLGLG